MTIKTFYSNPLRVCTYIISDEQNNAAIIDCGALTNKEQLRITNYIDSQHLRLTHHLLTHGHVDHMYGALLIFNQYKVLPSVHQDDLTIFLHPQEQAASYGLPIPQQFLTQCITIYSDQIINIGSISLKTIHTPGHTAGSVCFYCEKENLIFSGDTLFMGSIGRTDLYGSQPQNMPSSLEKIKKLPKQTHVYPGHGFDTDIQSELIANPYLR